MAFRLFNLTKNELNVIRASSSYSDILKNIKDANETTLAVQEKLNLLRKMTHPEEKDSIYEYTAILFANSTRLVSRVNVLNGKLQGKYLLNKIKVKYN